MKHSKQAALWTLSMATLFGVVGCGGKQDNTIYQTILQEGKIIVGTESGYAPYEFLDTSGTLQGLDIELVKLIADAIGEANDTTITVEFRDMEFGGLVGALSTQQLHMVAAGLNITSERLEKVDFSDIYIEEGMTILLRSNATDVEESADLANLKIGAQLGTTMVELAEGYVESGTGQVTTLSKNVDLVMQLRTGTLDAVVLESTVAANFVTNNTDLKIASYQVAISEDGGFAIAIPKGEPQLKAIINEVIETAKADGSIGRLFDAACELAAGE
jgi:polar amino acid transport system substrate-binding protein